MLHDNAYPTTCSWAYFSKLVLHPSLPIPPQRLPRSHQTYICRSLVRWETRKIHLFALRSMEHLYSPSHSSLCQSSSAENLDCFVCTFMSRTRCKHLEKTNWASKMCRLLFIWHQSHLVSYVFEPCLVGLAVSDHFSKPGIISFEQLA